MLPRCRLEPEVLEWARTSIRLDVGDAARRLKVPPDTLLDWEAFGAILAFTRIEKLSEVYRIPVAGLLFPKKPAKARLPVDRRTLPNKAGYSLSTATILAVLFAEGEQRAALELDALSDTPPPTLPAILGTENANHAASRLRAMLGVSVREQSEFRKSSVALKEWTARLETLGFYVLFRKWPLHEGRAFSLRGTHPVIVLNDSDEGVAQVFSMMHELCHLLRGEESLCDTALSGYEDTDRTIEVYCNSFAAELLVPMEHLLAHPVVSGHVGPEWSNSALRTVAASFAVSRETVLRRLLTAQLTTTPVYERERDRLQHEYEEYVARLALTRKAKRSSGPPWPDRVVHVRGRKFASQVVGAYSSGAISSSEASAYLGTTPRHLSGVGDLLG